MNPLLGMYSWICFNRIILAKALFFTKLSAAISCNCWSSFWSRRRCKSLVSGGVVMVVLFDIRIVLCGGDVLHTSIYNHRNTIFNTNGVLRLQ